MELALFRRLELDTGSISILRFFSSRDARLLVFNWKSGGDALESFFLD
jgi:hypothetical protein